MKRTKVIKETRKRGVRFQSKRIKKRKKGAKDKNTKRLIFIRKYYQKVQVSSPSLKIL
jgi:hypothetical protein